MIEAKLIKKKSLQKVIIAVINITLKEISRGYGYFRNYHYWFVSYNRSNMFCHFEQN